jgi:hypothetical protein
VNRPWAFSGLMSATALLLPLTVVPESRIQTGAPRAALSATAHVNFKIIIPKVLYLHVGAGNDRVAGAGTVAIMSNNRNVTLNATVRTPAGAIPPVSGDDARGNVILSAAARKVIAQDARCTLGFAPAAVAPADSRGRVSVDTRQVVCTASMP